VNVHIHISYLPSGFDIVSCLLQVSGCWNAGCPLVVELGELQNVNINAVRDTFLVFTQPLTPCHALYHVWF
jgi:hypothetical protein